MIDIVVAICFAIGGFLCLTAIVGLWRMPDFFTRIHGVGSLDSLGAGFILLGLAVDAGTWIDAVKCIMLYLFILWSSPAISHKLAQTAIAQGRKPDAEDY